MKKVFYVGLNVIIAVGLAAIWVSQNDGFGKGDISPFFFQTLVLSLLSLLMIKPLNWVFNKTNEILGLLLSLIISLVQTIVFILLLWFFIGPWIGAISFPFQLIWLTSISTVSRVSAERANPVTSPARPARLIAQFIEEAIKPNPTRATRSYTLVILLPFELPNGMRNTATGCFISDSNAQAFGQIIPPNAAHNQAL